MRDDPLFSDAPAIVCAREEGGVLCLDGTDDIGGSGQPPSRPISALTAVICVAFTSVWGYVFTSPDMPGIDPVINYAWFVPVGPLFSVIWFAATLGLIAAFYLVLRAPPSARARNGAIAAFLAQFILRAVWAWAFFAQRTPFGGLLLMVLLVLAVIASVILAARVDRRAALFMAPYLTWVSFVSLVTASTAAYAG
jgi:translocator protein